MKPVNKRRLSPYMEIISQVIFILLFLLLPTHSLAQKPKITWVEMQLKDDKIEVLYDLIGDPEKKVKVGLILRREGNPDFQYKPTYLSGDIGKGKYVGEKRKIIWNYKIEFTPDPNVTDYYAEVTVKPVRFTWLYYAGGGILLAGGATAAILLFGGDKGQPPQSGFPVPPRP